MNYEQALEYIHSLLKFGICPGLERINALLAMRSNPHKKLKFVHVAGTNGKGSTCTMIAEILQEAGYKTGLFTSPYVVDFRERIKINGEMIPKREFARLADEIKPCVESLSAQGLNPTEFEVITAIALEYYYAQSCDIVVLEVGLGGRLDSTNVIDTPLVSVITSISFDHMNILGDTIEEITTEKCGIIKEGGYTVSYPLQQAKVLEIIKKIAHACNNKFVCSDVKTVKVLKSDIQGTDIRYDGLELHIPLLGEHQNANAVTAIDAVEQLIKQGYGIQSKHIVAGIQNAKIPARMDIIHQNPLTIIDGAHNADGAQVLADSIQKYLKEKKIIAVMGMMADKEYQTATAKIAPLCDIVIATTPHNPRALSCKLLQKELSAYCQNTFAIDNPVTAFEKAKELASENDVIIVCGSLYLATEFYQ